MSFTGSQDAKELVRQAIDIVDLVGSYLQLRRQGRGYVGLCPWHDDSRPSMQVNPDRQSFKCWVCDIGGDVFSFTMKMENVEFREALEMLADRAGVVLEAAVAGPDAAPGSAGDKKTLFAALAWAEDRYHRCLLESAEGSVARKYLAERGISDDSVARFRIGFSPTGWDWLLRQGPQAGFSPAVLERVNLITPRKGGEGWYDQFRARLMFPIRDVRSRPVAFGGRVLPELAAAETRDDYRPAKYVNSTETPVYSKSHALYALDRARDAIQQSGQAIVMEGYTDVIVAHQNGVENAVAACGTAMGEGHLKLLRRFTDSIALVLDGDEAGRKRAGELLELFVSSPVDLRILTLPGGLDPCDFISSHGGDAFRESLTRAPDALEHKLQSVTSGMMLSADNTHEVARAVEQVLGTLARVRSALGEASSTSLVREQGILGRLSRRFHLPEEGLRTRLADLRRGAPLKPLVPLRDADTTDDEPTGPPLSAWEREALELMLTGPAMAATLAERLDEVDFASDEARQLLCLVRDLADQWRDRSEESEGPTFARLMLATEDERLKNQIVELDEQGRGRWAADPHVRFRDLLGARTRKHDEVTQRHQVDQLRRKELSAGAEDEAVAALFAARKHRETGPLSTDG
ncbi:MAG: DNA primase [Lacipirellulaceae bacterium]